MSHKTLHTFGNTLKTLAASMTIEQFHNCCLPGFITTEIAMLTPAGISSIKTLLPYSYIKVSLNDTYIYVKLKSE